MNRLFQIQEQLGKPVPIKFSDEVSAALKEPAGFAKVVALESTIISHGMPYPQNVECAKELEAIVRKNGAVPATIAILDGVIHVGLSEDKLELLGKIGRKCAKVSRRDLPTILAQKKNGATTVSGTILIAKMVGIAIMATGGIGGVHRGAETTFDISADLTELGRTRVLVVCAGVKSILDIPKTLEVLETQGVPVIGYKTNTFPAFFTRDSGCNAPLRMDSDEEVAQFVAELRRLQYPGGGILAVPIPKEQEANNVEGAIQQALKECSEKIKEGRDVTPFLLGRVNELTKGESLRSNLALVKNNTLVASRVAGVFHKLMLSEISKK